MKLLNYTIKIIIALYLARFVSGLVIRENYMMFSAIASGVLFLIIPWRCKFILLSIAAFYPFFIPGSFFVINSPDWIMIIAPITCFIFIIELAINKQPLFSGKAAIFFVAVGVMCLWALVNYIKNPVLGEQFTGAAARQGGIKSYFLIFVGATTFLSSFWFIRYKKINIDLWLIILFGLSFFIGILRIFGYFYRFEIPLLGGPFTYMYYTPHVALTNDIRIGGLSECAVLALSVLIAFFYNKKLNKYTIFIFISCFAMLVLSGGRATFAGTVISLLVYSSVINKKYFLPMALVIVLFAGTYFFILPNLELSKSIFGRVTRISEDSINMEVGRIEEAKIFLKLFWQNPVFGKGIGYDPSLFRDLELEAGYLTVAKGDLSMGGHGSYWSILGIFGIGGIFFLVIMLFGSIFHAYKMFKSDMQCRDDTVKLIIFALFNLITLSMSYIAGGSGYGDMTLWFLAGMIAGILAKNGDNQCLITISR